MALKIRTLSLKKNLDILKKKRYYKSHRKVSMNVGRTSTTTTMSSTTPEPNCELKRANTHLIQNVSGTNAQRCKESDDANEHKKLRGMDRVDSKIFILLLLVKFKIKQTTLKFKISFKIRIKKNKTVWRMKR